MTDVQGAGRVPELPDSLDLDGARYRGYRILVIDDDRPCATLLSDLLRVDGCEVITAYDGREAIELLSDRVCQGLSPNFIFLDMHMDGGDGWDFAAQLRQMDLAIPTVVVTGDPHPERCASEIGAVAYLAKPLDFSDLDHVLDGLIVIGTDGARGRRQSVASHPESATRSQLSPEAGLQS
jgi:CheY-like chemotaxis protein